VVPLLGCHFTASVLSGFRSKPISTGVYLYGINKEIKMTMFKRLTMLICASLFVFSQAALASDEGQTVEKAAETAKEMATEATAAGAPTDEEKMKEGEMKNGEMKEGEMKDEMPANQNETK
jgi:uncharacterized membrane protein